MASILKPVVWRPAVVDYDTVVVEPQDGLGHGTTAGAKAFVNSASTHSEPVCTVEHGRAAVLTCLVVRASVDAGAAVMTDQVA